MRFPRTIPSILLLGGLALAQGKEELTPYSHSEIDNFLQVFKQTYKAKKTPEDDAVAVLDDLKKAYLYLDAKGEEMTKEDEKYKKKIVDMIAKGLRARKRGLVTMHCVMKLGEIRAESASKHVMKWLEGVIDEKNPNPQHVEKGFLTLAHIGGKDKRAMDLALDYATKGKHPDMTVANWAIRACYEWSYLDGKTRREFFNKILGYVGGLHSNSVGGEANKRATFEQRYNAVKDHGMKALNQLAGAGANLADIKAAREFWSENKKKKWEPYHGPAFRAAAAKKKAEEKGAEGG